MKVLVTGATGFVGSHTAKALIDAGHSVRLLVRSKTKTIEVFERLGCRIEDIHLGDITDENAVKKAVAGCDAVIHSAAMVSTAEKDAEMVYKTNVGGTKTVINCSLEADVKQIIYVSSVSALFNIHDSVMNESSSLCEAGNPYGRSKVDCEIFARELQDQGKPVVITYPTGVVGTCDPALSEPHFGLKMFIGQFTFTSSTGMQFVNVKDIAKAHIAILEQINGPDRFMLGGCFYSWQDLLAISRKLTGRTLFAWHIPGPVLRFLGKCADIVTKLTGLELPMTAEGMSYASQWVYADSSKMENELGIQFTDREETLKEAISWLHKTGELSTKQVGLLAQ